MDEFEPKPTEVETYKIGENLYGLSLYELEARISAYTEEIERLRRELDKKNQDRNAADALFTPKT